MIEINVVNCSNVDICWRYGVSILQWNHNSEYLSAYTTLLNKYLNWTDIA